ncbi:MAG: replication factor C large subunit [Candidatus Methanoperedens sp.]|nr:replication factor C large subunit [Candidatus Methanoperedens sp.]MCE8425168.1 replication factor C large subunit [Candidatus Methanoperedens sp.]MCE8429316.1 replication factor C large subunit [Candidatus Methanoperedens sp.]
MTSLDWTEKYRPQTLSQVVGHNKPVDELIQWARAWEKGIPKDRAVVLYGKAGIGKTSAAHALAREMGWEVIELNASDQRTAEIIEKVVGSASQMSTLEGKKTKRLVIMDEADNIHGTADRGGEKAIVDLIKRTSQPIILIANEMYDMSPGLRTACKPIQFNSVLSRSMIPALKRIAEAEGITCSIGVLEKLAENANGDLRSAINDFQAMAQGKSKLEPEDLKAGERDTKENIFKVLAKIFKGKDISEAHKSTFNLDENPEDLIQWIDENLPLEYKEPGDLEEGYRHISRASQFLGRVNRRQNYKMWRYASVMMTSGIVVSRSGHYSGYSKFNTPSFWRKLGQTKSMRSIRDSAAKKIGTHCHVSMSFARSRLMPFFRLMLRNDNYSIQVAAILGLIPEEIAFLTESKSVTKKVQKIYDEAQKLAETETIHEIEVFGGFGVKRSEVKIENMEKEDKPEVKIKKDANSQSSLFDF